jgi:hypothetical protein
VEKGEVKSMKIRKDMIFAILTTFCMCALMFTVIPIRSGLPYDPWADIDDNGKIDMKDIGNVAARFMASGDSTKNVNVTNWPLPYPPFKTILYTENFTWWNYTGDICFYPHPQEADDVGGYSKMSVEVLVKDAGPRVYGWTNITLNSMQCGISGLMASQHHQRLTNTPTNSYYMEWGGAPPIGQMSGSNEVFWRYITVYGVQISSTLETGWILVDIYLYFWND